jgi:hypothetical protein
MCLLEATMSVTTLIWYVAGGGAVVLLMVATTYWSVNYFTQQLGQRTLERFHAHLAQEVEAALEIFRERMCDQVVLQGKKSDSLANLYAILIDILRLGREFCTTCGKEEPVQVEKKVRAINDGCRNFFDQYHKESLHFAGEFCSTLDSFAILHKEVMNALEKELYRKDVPERVKEMEYRKVWLRLEDRVVAVMDLVRHEFHRRNPSQGAALRNGLNELPPHRIMDDTAAGSTSAVSN